MAAMGSSFVDPHVELLSWPWLSPAICSFFGVIVLFMTSKLWSPRKFESYQKLTPSDRLDWDSKYASTLHAVILTLTAPVAIAQWYRNQTAPITLWTSYLTNWSLGISLGYFAADTLLLMLYFPKLGDGPMAVHHTVASLAVISSVFGRVGHIYTLAMLVTECTTPSINLRWFLDKAGMKDTKMYLYNGLLMMFSWLVMRILLFILFFRSLLQHWEDVKRLPLFASVMVVTIPLLLSILNAFWFFKIIRGAVKLLTKQRNCKEKGS